VENAIGSNPRSTNSDGDAKSDGQDACPTRAGTLPDGCPVTAATQPKGKKKCKRKKKKRSAAAAKKCRKKK
jgi:hypothetical protein